MKAILAVAAFWLLGAASHAWADGECKPMSTDAERLKYWCAEHPGPSCEATGRQMLPYISDYANCPDVDSAGRPISHDHCADFSPLPPDCVGAGAPGSVNGGGTTSTSGAGSGSSGASGGTTAGGAAVGAMPVPLNCLPIRWHGLTIYKDWYCACPPNTGHAPISWGQSGGEGTGAAIAFRPKTGPGYFHAIATPAVPSSPNCQVLVDILDKDGVSTGCKVRGLTNDNGIALNFTGGPPQQSPRPLPSQLAANAPKTPAKASGPCNLTPGAQYFVAYTLLQRVPNPYAPEGMQNWCGLTYDRGYNIEPAQP